MVFFYAMWLEFKNSKNRFFMASHFRTLLFFAQKKSFKVMTSQKSFFRIFQFGFHNLELQHEVPLKVQNQSIILLIIDIFGKFCIFEGILWCYFMLCDVTL